MGRVTDSSEQVGFERTGRIGEMNGHPTPKRFEVVVADPLDRTGKAEERQALKRACPRPPGALAPACSQELVHELGRSRVLVRRRWTVERRKPRYRSTGKSDHAIGAVNRVMTGEQRAWRKEEVANEEIGTAHRGGQPFRTQSWRGV